jgi:EmrB/QacA subfamily drug resistance transporter
VSERASVGLRSERGPVLLSLMVATSLVALDSTIIATAVPSVVASLGGFTAFPWLFSIYLLAQAVSVPILGRFADLFGRRPVLLAGIGLFLIGSVLCGFAWNMGALIAFRAVQGLGAGAIQPTSMTVAGDLYSLAERARVQGYFASVWAISAVLGPTLGGVFAEYVSWRWIFFVNIPLCLVAAFILIRNYSETVERRPHKLDYQGAFFLTLGCGLLILGLLEGGSAWPWNSVVSVLILSVGPILLVLFLLAERRATEPILPLWILRRRLLAAGNGASLIIGAVLIGLTSFVPTYVQYSLGTGPLTAGFALALLTIGWPIAASTSGRVYLRIGFRRTALIGAVTVLVGAAATTTLNADSAVWQVAAYCFVIGFGMGYVASPTLIAAQTSVGWSERGVVTGTNMFARSVGSAVGVAVFGAIANASLSEVPEAGAVATATHGVFIATASAAVLMLFAVLLMPTDRPARRSPQEEPTVVSEGAGADVPGSGH